MTLVFTKSKKTLNSLCKPTKSFSTKTTKPSLTKSPTKNKRRGNNLRNNPTIRNKYKANTKKANRLNRKEVNPPLKVYGLYGLNVNFKIKSVTSNDKKEVSIQRTYAPNGSSTNHLLIKALFRKNYLKSKKRKHVFRRLKSPFLRLRVYFKFKNRYFYNKTLNTINNRLRNLDQFEHKLVALKGQSSENGSDRNLRLNNKVSLLLGEKSHETTSMTTPAEIALKAHRRNRKGLTKFDFKVRSRWYRRKMRHLKGKRRKFRGLDPKMIKKIKKSSRSLLPRKMNRSVQMFKTIRRLSRIAKVLRRGWLKGYKNKRNFFMRRRLNKQKKNLLADKNSFLSTSSSTEMVSKRTLASHYKNKTISTERSLTELSKSNYLHKTLSYKNYKASFKYSSRLNRNSHTPVARLQKTRNKKRLNKLLVTRKLKKILRKKNPARLNRTYRYVRRRVSLDKCILNTFLRSTSRLSRLFTSLLSLPSLLRTHTRNTKFVNRANSRPTLVSNLVDGNKNHSLSKLNPKILAKHHSDTSLNLNKGLLTGLKSSRNLTNPIHLNSLNPLLLNIKIKNREPSTSLLNGNNSRLKNLIHHKTRQRKGLKKRRSNSRDLKPKIKKSTLLNDIKVPNNKLINNLVYTLKTQRPTNEGSSLTKLLTRRHKPIHALNKLNRNRKTVSQRLLNWVRRRRKLMYIRTTKFRAVWFRKAFRHKRIRKNVTNFIKFSSSIRSKKSFKIRLRKNRSLTTHKALYRRHRSTTRTKARKNRSTLNRSGSYKITNIPMSSKNYKPAAAMDSAIAKTNYLAPNSPKTTLSNNLQTITTSHGKSQNIWTPVLQNGLKVSNNPQLARPKYMDYNNSTRHTLLTRTNNRLLALTKAKESNARRRSKKPNKSDMILKLKTKSREGIKSYKQKSTIREDYSSLITDRIDHKISITKRVKGQNLSTQTGLSSSNNRLLYSRAKNLKANRELTSILVNVRKSPKKPLIPIRGRGAKLSKKFLSEKGRLPKSYLNLKRYSRFKSRIRGRVSRLRYLFNNSSQRLLDLLSVLRSSKVGNSQSSSNKSLLKTKSVLSHTSFNNLLSNLRITRASLRDNAVFSNLLSHVDKRHGDSTAYFARTQSLLQNSKHLHSEAYWKLLFNKSYNYIIPLINTNSSNPPITNTLDTSDKSTTNSINKLSISLYSKSSTSIKSNIKGLIGVGTETTLGATISKPVNDNVINFLVANTMINISTYVSYRPFRVNEVLISWFPSSYMQYDNTPFCNSHKNDPFAKSFRHLTDIVRKRRLNQTNLRSFNFNGVTSSNWFSVVNCLVIQPVNLFDRSNFYYFSRPTNGRIKAVKRRLRRSKLNKIRPYTDTPRGRQLQPLLTPTTFNQARGERLQLKIPYLNPLATLGPLGRQTKSTTSTNKNGSLKSIKHNTLANNSLIKNVSKFTAQNFNKSLKLKRIAEKLGKLGFTNRPKATILGASANTPARPKLKRVLVTKRKLRTKIESLTKAPFKRRYYRLKHSLRRFINSRKGLLTLHKNLKSLKRSKYLSVHYNKAKVETNLALDNLNNDTRKVEIKRSSLLNTTPTYDLTTNKLKRLRDKVTLNNVLGIVRLRAIQNSMPNPFNNSIKLLPSTPLTKSLKQIQPLHHDLPVSNNSIRKKRSKKVVYKNRRFKNRFKNNNKHLFKKIISKIISKHKATSNKPRRSRHNRRSKRIKRSNKLSKSTHSEIHLNRSYINRLYYTTLVCASALIQLAAPTLLRLLKPHRSVTKTQKPYKSRKKTNKYSQLFFKSIKPKKESNLTHRKWRFTNRSKLRRKKIKKIFSNSRNTRTFFRWVRDRPTLIKSNVLTNISKFEALDTLTNFIKCKVVERVNSSYTKLSSKYKSIFSPRRGFNLTKTSDKTQHSQRANRKLIQLSRRRGDSLHYTHERLRFEQNADKFTSLIRKVDTPNQLSISTEKNSWKSPLNLQTSLITNGNTLTTSNLLFESNSASLNSPLRTFNYSTLTNYNTFVMFINNPILLFNLATPDNSSNTTKGLFSLPYTLNFLTSKFVTNQISLQISNLVPHYAFNKKMVKSYSVASAKKKFLHNITPYVHNSIIRFLEDMTGFKSIFQFYPFLHQNIDREWILRYKIWASRLTYFERRLGHKFFIDEALWVMHLSLYNKDARLFSAWLKAIILRISFWKTRFIFRFMRYLFNTLFYFAFPELNVRGIKIRLKGKISVGGNSRTRTILYRSGKTTHSTVSIRVARHLDTIRTFTGVMGFELWIFY